MRKILLLCVVMLLSVGPYLLSSCASIGAKITQDAVVEIGASGQNFDSTMAAFMVNWPYVSGTMEGYFTNREQDFSVAMRDARIKLDAIYDKGGAAGKWEKRDLGLAHGLCLNLFSLAVKNWLTQMRPDLLTIIPAFLLP